MRAAISLGSPQFGLRPLGVAKSSTDLTSYTQAAAPVLAALVTTKDSTETAETLRAQIKNHKHLRDTFPDPLKTLYANKVTILEAKLRAALDLRKRDTEDRRSKYEWSALGKAGIITGIVTGGAIILLLVAGARRVGRTP